MVLWVERSGGLGNLGNLGNLGRRPCSTVGPIPKLPKLLKLPNKEKAFSESRLPSATPSHHKKDCRGSSLPRNDEETTATPTTKKKLLD